ncbi:MAG: c-type cytochrome, partial [Myxococcales bacterium]
MKRDALAVPLTLLVATACSRMPGRPSADSEVARPEAITAFEPPYRADCAGCHGENGRRGPATALADPLYLAIADDATIRKVVSNGVAGTAMPAFAREAGGMLTQRQVEAIVAGIRERWAKPDTVRNVHPPPYSAAGEGDPKHGAAVYTTYCASCHGQGGRGGEKASSIVDGSFLALVSDQSLRTTVIVGRP